MTPNQLVIRLHIYLAIASFVVGLVVSPILFVCDLPSPGVVFPILFGAANLWFARCSTQLEKKDSELRND
jgi:hypothetical protein